MNEVAVNILADSSVSLASQWSLVIAYYVSKLLTRLLEGRSGDSFNISIVTYATADHRPTPIIAKRYFNNPSEVSQELREDVQKLGIGQTGSGGKTGMAALEGYAAALEMFDLFLSSHRSSREVTQDKQPLDGQTSPLCHIIHVSAAAPDDVRHPLWNQTSCLDSLSWKTLPEELRKRNINLSMILLKPNKQFADLHSLVNPEPHKIWFDMPNATHNILLSSQASWAPLISKRTNENTESDKAPDTKRARVPTPKQAPAALPRQASPPPKSTGSAVPPPPVSAQSAQTSVAQPPAVRDTLLAQLPQAILKMRELEVQLKQGQAQAEVLRQQGRVQDMENLKRILHPKIAAFFKIKQFVTQVKAATTAAAAPTDPHNPAMPTEMRAENIAGPSGQNQMPPPAAAAATAAAPPPPPSITPSQTSQPNPGQNIQQFVQAQRQAAQVKAGGPGPDGRPPSTILPQLPPNVAAQMQKLQMKEGIQGQTSLSATPMHQHQPQQQQHGLMNQPAQPPPSLPQNQPPPGSSESQAWVGTLSWMNPQMMSRVDAQVRLFGNQNVQPHRWSPTIEVELLRDHQAAPIPVLKEWIGRHKPILCQIRSFPTSIDQQENMLRLKSLSSLLFERNIYAVGRRAPASENMKPMLLLFPMGGDGGQIAAAVFPETGVPDVPRANAAALPITHPTPAAAPILSMGNINANQAQMLAMIQKMNPEQRTLFMARFRQQQQVQQVQAQQAAAAGGANPPGQNVVPNFTGGNWASVGGGMSGGGVSQQGMQNMPPQGMPGAGGMGANINFAQALAAMQQQQQQQQQQHQQQRQNAMHPPPGSGGQPMF